MILLDTSVLISHETLDMPTGPWALSSLSLSELAFGVTLSADVSARAHRQARLTHWDSIGLEWLPFDRAAAEGYAIVAAEVWKARRGHARSRDTMLAGQAYALGASIATLNPRDFQLVNHLVPIIVPPALGGKT
ncbi:MAG: hypothetical protein FWD59_04615 [Micrococcales bacterium]|nr:hypothetical protein [Micrococcales bacterium]